MIFHIRFSEKYMRAFVFITIMVLAASANAQTNITLLGQLSYEQLSSLWGYTAADGTEYALVGASNGLSVVSLADPTDPQELFFVPGPESAWREIKTYDHYDYVSNETGGGILIVDLEGLPDAIDTVWYKGDTLHPILTAHTLFIDENGILYLFGPNVVTGLLGTYMLDLSDNPVSPEYVGSYNDIYFHDGFVRNDTLWAAEIYEGRFEVFDISDKSSFVSLGYAYTYALSTHNCEPDETGNLLFTSDEIFNGYITAWDISDLTDCKELYRYKHGDTAQAVPHNVRVLGDFLVVSHYSEGVLILDAGRPDLLVETGHFDTSPAEPDLFFEGAWEVYPYFESGLMIVSDIQEGLFVLQPDYVQAAYLEGEVRDEAVPGMTISAATILLESTDIEVQTDLMGGYVLGYGTPGLYDVTVSAEGCETKTYKGIELVNGSTTNLDAFLDCGTSSVLPNDDCAQLTCSYAEGMLQLTAYGSCVDINNVRLTIFDMQGREVFVKEVSWQGNLLIPIQLPPGSYFLSLDEKSRNRFVVSG